MILTLLSLQGFFSGETSLSFFQITLLSCSSILFHSILFSNFFIYSSSLSLLLFFHLFQFLSSFFKYSSSNFLLSHPHNNFAVYFPSNSIFLNSSALVLWQLLDQCLIATLIVNLTEGYLVGSTSCVIYKRTQQGTTIVFY